MIDRTGIDQKNEEERIMIDEIKKKE